MGYDIKRSIAEPLTIILLIGLILAGIGIAYLEVGSYSSQLTSYSVVLSYNISKNQTKILGLALTPQGNPVKNAKVLINNIWVRTNSSGYFLISYSTGSFGITSPTKLQISGVNYTASLNDIAVVNVNIKAKTAELYVGNFILNMPNYTSYKIYYAQESLENFSKGIRPENYTYIGNISGFTIKKFSIKLSEGSIVVKLIPINSSINYEQMYYYEVPQFQVSNIRNTVVVAASYIFAEFFPLVGLFLANELFAGIRSNNAIDFIVSRPITKKQLIASRYVGGLFALVLGSLITSILIPLTVSYMLNTSVTLYTIGKLFGMLLIDTIGFYSLLFLVATLERKHFLIISIVLYLLLYLFNIMNIIAIFMNIPELMYATPYGLYEIVIGLNLSLFSFNVNYALVTIIGILWIVIPIALAIIIYDKLDAP